MNLLNLKNPHMITEKYEHNHPLNDDIWNKWKDYMKVHFDLTLSEEVISKFKIYLTKLIDWNKKINLISISSPQDIIWRHFTDSLAGYSAIPEYIKKSKELKIIDVGTGAGFPGIPLELVFPSWKLTLLESLSKKCRFLENVVEILELDNTSIINDRAESAAHITDFRERFDISVSRALSELSVNLELTMPFIKKGGICLIYKTEKCLQKENISHILEVINLLGGKEIEEFSYNLPNRDILFKILVIEKINSTPMIYPRKIGIPKKNPL